MTARKSITTVLALGLCLMTEPVVGQSTITVNTTNDDTTAADGLCTLREAINNANSNADTTGGDCVAGTNTGTDTIAFNISGAGVHTITPESDFPGITDPVVIDGETQGAADCGTTIASRTLTIVLDGSSDPGSFTALLLAPGSDGSTVRGLVVNNWPGSGISINGSNQNVVECNYIGTDVSGTVALGNAIGGIAVFAPTGTTAIGNRIGGTTAGSGNLISGNYGGVSLIAPDAMDNLVQGNYIGTNAAGTGALGNQRGVTVEFDATNNTLGGTTAGAGNRIAFNSEGGVFVVDSGATNNAILGNSIFDNGNLGIDLGNDGVTPNDPGDADTGPNQLQNFPALTASVISGGDLLVTYWVDTDPANAAYDLRVEFFEADAAGQEGAAILGSDPYTSSDHPGLKQVNLGSAAALGISLGTRLVATATDDEGNTSEFSAPVVTSTVTRYVAPTGDDTNNDCTDALNPCATIAHAVDEADGGDTIDLAPGTYTEPGLVIDKALRFQGAGVVVQ